MCYGENIGIKFNIVKPKINIRKPYYDANHNRFFFPVHKNYRYYLEATSVDEAGFIRYYIFVGKEQFNPSCRRCEVNGIGNCRLQLHNEVKDYIQNECAERGNITAVLIDENADYDTYNIV